jgi:membrane-associated protein
MSVDAAPIIGLAGLILVKEAGIPIPVPGDLLVIGAGAAAARGDVDPLTTLVALIVASAVGGAVQFGLLRSVARRTVLGLLSKLAGAEWIDTQAARLRHAGARGVAVARLTPGVRIPAIAASALASVPAPAFLTGLIIGNGLFIAAHFGLGFVVGEPVVRLVGGLLGPLAAVLVVLAIVGAVGWTLLARRRRRSVALPALAAWADACCPACLAAAVVAR